MWCWIYNLFKNLFSKIVLYIDNHLPKPLLFQTCDTLTESLVRKKPSKKNLFRRAMSETF